MKKTIISVLAAIITFTFGYSQTFSDISVRATLEEAGDTTHKMQIYPLLFYVNHRIELENYDSDTLVLTLKKGDYNKMFKDFFFQELEVSLEKEGTPVVLEYFFDGEQLKIPIEIKNSVVNVSYLFQSDFGMKNSSTTVLYLTPFMNEWHSWYFVNDDIPIKSLTVNVPDNLTFYSNVSSVKKGNIYELDVENTTADPNISLYFLDNEYYEKKTFENSGVKCNVQLLKGVIVDTIQHNMKDSIIVYPDNRITTDYEKKVKETVNNSLKHLVSIFGVENIDEINIVEASLSLELDNDSIYTWGRQFNMNDKQSVILIDTSYWDKNSVQHELVHSFDAVSVPKTDSSHYFFSESLVEYLSLTIKYGSEDKIDSVFQKILPKIDKMGYEIDSLPSIFTATENLLNLAGIGNEINIVIYQKVPLLLHNFAKEVGYERFVMNLCKFYHIANSEKMMNMQLFEKYMRQGIAISDEKWRLFIKSL